MTPIHPRLKQALLLDADHRQRGLTQRKFRQYEILLAQLFYASQYGDGGKDRDRLLEEIRRFRQQFMPNFDRLHESWVQRQERALSASLLNWRSPEIAAALKALWRLLRHPVWLKSRTAVNENIR